MTSAEEATKENLLELEVVAVIKKFQAVNRTHLVKGQWFGTPIENHEGNGWRSSSDLVEFVVDWDETVSEIFREHFVDESAFPYIRNLISNLEIFEGENKLDENQILHIIIADILVGTYEYQFNSNTIVAQLIDFTVRKEDDIIAHLPLKGIVFDEKIDLSFGTFFPPSFSQKADHAKKNWLDDVRFGRHLGIHSSKFEILSAESILIVKIKVPREKGLPPLFRILSLTQTILTLVRLFCYGNIYEVAPIFYKQNVVNRQLRYFNPQQSRDPLALNDAYKIQDPVEFKNFLERFHSQPNPIPFIYSRLSSAWISGKDQNSRIFDYVAILEAILIGGNESELAFKISIYGSYLVHVKGKSRREVYDLLKKAYLLRSKIAHCTPLKPRDILEQREIKLFGEIVHRLIRASMETNTKEIQTRAMKLLMGEAATPEHVSVND